MLHQSPTRYNVAAWGRQSGKTTYGKNKIKMATWTKPATYWFILPIYNQAKKIYKRFEKDFFKSQNAVVRDYSKTDLYFKLLSGGEFFCVSGEVFDNLRMETLAGVVIDEFREQKKDLWPLVIRPMLATTNGWADFLSTTNGFDDFYELYQKAKDDQGGTWSAFTAPSTCNPLFKQSEFEEARKDMSELQFRQEILAEFVNLASGKVYKNYGDHNLVDSNPFAPRGADYSPHLPIVVGLDFNVTPMCWHLGQTNNIKIHWEDRIWLTNSDTAEACEELVSKVSGHAPGVILVGDSAGKARSTKASAGETDYSIIHATLKKHNIKYQDLTPTENPLQKDRVNTMNARLKSASGEVCVTLNRNKTKELQRDFMRVIWKEGSQASIDKTDPLLTHASDSVGYPTCVILPLRDIADVGGLWVLNRG